MRPSRALMAISIGLPLLTGVHTVRAEIHQVVIDCDYGPGCFNRTLPFTADLRPGDQVQWVINCICGDVDTVAVSVPPGQGFPGFVDTVLVGTMTDVTPPVPASGAYEMTRSWEDWAGRWTGFIVRESDATTLNLYLTEPSYAGCSLVDNAVLDRCDDLVSSPGDGPGLIWVILS